MDEDIEYALLKTYPDFTAAVVDVGLASLEDLASAIAENPLGEDEALHLVNMYDITPEECEAIEPSKDLYSTAMNQALFHL